jgi:DNA repair exonuclease SbcCD ATPase subunit
MRTSTLFIVALIACAAFAGKLRSKSGLSSTDMNKLKQVGAHKTGKILLNLAALQITTQGPLDAFWRAIDELDEDLQDQLEAENDQWDETEVNHESSVLNLEQNINDAEFDVASTRQRIDNTLVPQRNDLEVQLESDASSIEENQAQIDAETVQRNEEHDRFALQDREHTEAIEAIDEAIELAEQLVNGETGLLQVKKAKNTIKAINEKLSQMSISEAPFISALIKLASGQSWEDQQDFREIVALLNDLRGKVVASQEELNEEEDAAQESFEERTGLLNREITEWKIRINDNTVTLTNVNAQIDEDEEFAGQRADDLETYNEQLDLENESYRQLSLLHEELTSELLDELEVVAAVRDICGNDNFTDYVNRILDQDYVWEAEADDDEDDE